MSVKKYPFDFVFDYLFPIEPVVKPMFGCHALYVGKKIVLILRDRPTRTDANGVWIATTAEHHDSLKKELPSMCSITVLGEGDTNWQMIPSSAGDFEESVIKLCEMVRRGDPRVGKVPKVKKKRAAETAKKKKRR
jgi:hypothetical protein